jgi:3-hydroxy-9,10-secoandrosta-1,3,5(10)-triene-9,17-dione monooxygenase
MTMTRIGAEEVVARARALSPRFAEQNARGEEIRTLPEETMELIREARFTQILQPARFGGLELGYDIVNQVLIEIARVNASAAWVTMVFNTGTMTAGFPVQAQEELWAGGPDVLVGGVFAPTTRLERLDGAYRISGRWPFASGCDHADWMMLAGLVQQEDQAPDQRFFLVPKGEYTIEDDWHVSGLRGTGSKMVVAENIEVPAHRSCSMADLREGKGPGTEVNTAPVFRIPLAAVYHGGAAAPAIGIAKGAVERWREWVAGRYAHGVVRMADQVTTQIHLAESAADVEAAEVLLRHDGEEVRSRSESGPEITLEDRGRFHRNAAYITALCVRAVDRLFEVGGGSGLYDRNPIQQPWRDVHAVQGHVSNRWDDAMEHWGRLVFGRGVTNPFFY